MELGARFISIAQNTPQNVVIVNQFVMRQTTISIQNFASQTAKVRKINAHASLCVYVKFYVSCCSAYAEMQEAFCTLL
jgi:hypothetical protein